MKKSIEMLLTMVVILALSTYIGQASVILVAQAEVMPKLSYDTEDLNSMLSFIKRESETFESEIVSKVGALRTTLGEPYNSYVKNKDAVTAFYEQTQTDTQNYYGELQTVIIHYYKCISSNIADDYDAWNNAMDDMYDAWNDGMEDVYDAWNDALDDVYKDCDDIISNDASKIEYKDYSDVWSEMYKNHADAWSEQYSSHSKKWSTLYNNHSDVWSGFYRGKTDIDTILNNDMNANRTDNGTTIANSIAEANSAEMSIVPVTGSSSFVNVESAVMKDIEDTLARLNSELEELATRTATYEAYLNNFGEIEVFYGKIEDESLALCIRMRKYSLNIAEAILASDKSSGDMYDDADDIYDIVYEDAGDEIYDGIYDGVLDDLYDAFYNGALDDWNKNVDYGEWSDIRSDEYDWWSDARSECYDQWSDMRSDVYDFWSDIRGEIWDKGIDRAKDKIENFRGDVERMEAKVTGAKTEIISLSAVEITDTTAPIGQLDNDAGNSIEVESSDESADVIRPEFKKAMDAYEAFYDEYCNLLQEYKTNHFNLTILIKYGEMMKKTVEMNEAFEKWNKDDLTKEELKYYLEVNNRVMKKLIDVAG